ncbi:transporter [Arcobacter caeni]|uniref:Transporter n=1 Tax=Arcobacter caeni TaxID=1912877 RepID=A0A363D5F6_9BACT|nr:transporter [Arcobacter caeni]PUE66561.1 transporter [Arcobacter caeni]
MKKERFVIISAVTTALLSTLCCLPAFLFIFFGFSSGVLTYFATLEYTRIPLVILTIILFIFAFKSLKKKISCKCERKEIFKQYLFFFIFFILIMALLFYPEFLSLFME